VIDLTEYLLGAAVICTALYLFTSRRVTGEFFGYLVLIGFMNVAVAGSNVLRLPLAWQAVVVAGLAILLVYASRALHGRAAWADLAVAARRSSFALLPLVVVGSLAFQIYPFGH